MNRIDFDKQFTDLLERVTGISKIDEDMDKYVNIDLDSLDLVEIIMASEDQFNVEIDEDDVIYQDFTFQHLYDKIYEKIRTK